MIYRDINCDDTIVQCLYHDTMEFNLKCYLHMYNFKPKVVLHVVKDFTSSLLFVVGCYYYFYPTEALHQSKNC